MFNSNLKNSYHSKRPKSIEPRTMPYFSTAKSSKKYYTPFKSNLTTMNTNNNTLSLYSTKKVPPKKFYSFNKDISTIELEQRKSSNNKKSEVKKSKVKTKFQKKMSKKTSKKVSMNMNKKDSLLEQ
jgi:hypothetical protein